MSSAARFAVHQGDGVRLPALAQRRQFVSYQLQRFVPANFLPVAAAALAQLPAGMRKPFRAVKHFQRGLSPEATHALI